MDAKTVIFLQSLLLIYNFSVCTCSPDSITINQIIKDGDLLISQQKYFALGFFSPGKSTYRYLGIWFHKIPVQTVVWVANRNNPINGSLGILAIDQTRNLVLYSDHHRKVAVWSANVSAGGDACAAQLLDTGNFVLVQNRSRRIIWQSFDYPTNIMIQGMKLGIDKKTGMDRFLNSWRSAGDPGTGNYSYRLNPNGSPQLLLHKGNHRISWRSGPWPWRSYAEVYNYTFVNNPEEIYFSFSIDYSSVILVVVMDETGLLRRLTWHESEGQWKEFWSAPKHRCDTYGQCGPNSLCDPYNFTSYECACLPGYEPKSPRDWRLRDGSAGCIRKRLETSSVCGKGEGFLKVASVKSPDSSAAVWIGSSMTQTDCENKCRTNCSCSAYASIPIPGEGTGCLSWYGELIDTVDHVDYGYDLYVRVDALELAEDARRSNRFLKMKGMLAILILSVVSAWFVIFIFLYLWLRRKRGKSKRNRRSIDPISGCKDGLTPDELDYSRRQTELVFFNLNAMLVATNNFSPANIIGQGGFGSVYKGQLANGQEIAVKRLSMSSGQGKQEFKNEVMLIAKFQHRNLVKLLGCCIQGEERILTYEYLPNGSLDTFLFDNSRNSLLSWRIRFNIIIGIARGILYLHQDSRLRVIHRDLKSSNILLDAEMNPKISDFGLARIFKGDQFQYKTKRVVGTYGYMSPEYAVFGRFSIKSDVFSFGVILLEIVSGRKSNGFIEENTSLSLIGHVWELWREDRALEIIDSSLKEYLHNYDEALRCIQVGLLCVQEDALDRPNMLDVTLMLSSETSLPCPKQPAFIFRKSCSSFNSSLMENDGSCSINDLTVTAVSSR